MDNAVGVSLSPLDIVLVMAYQIWIIVFPIIIIRKLNYLTALISSQGFSEDEESDA